MRIIVCGSRDWTDRDTVWRALDDVYATERKWGTGHGFVVVHGACQDRLGNPLGADRFADEWARSRGVTVKQYPADWDGPLGLGAGPKRNRDMANDGADLCLAMWNGENRKGKEPGTLGMIRLALKAGIAVRIVPPRRRT